MVANRQVRDSVPHRPVPELALVPHSEQCRVAGALLIIGQLTELFDTVINKTPLSYKTNRILGGVAPSVYLARLEGGGKDAPLIEPDALNEYLVSHAMNPALLRADDLANFMADRESRLLAMIARATGHSTALANAAPEEGEDLREDDEGFDLPAPDTEAAA